MCGRRCRHHHAQAVASRHQLCEQRSGQRNRHASSPLPSRHSHGLTAHACGARLLLWHSHCLHALQLHALRNQWLQRRCHLHRCYLRTWCKLLLLCLSHSVQTAREAHTREQQRRLLLLGGGTIASGRQGAWLMSAGICSASPSVASGGPTTLTLIAEHCKVLV